MLYFDTSFLTPLFLQEPTSEKIQNVFTELSGEHLAVSHWTKVEFSSLLARQVRMGDLKSSDAAAADAEFESIVKESFIVLLPSMSDFELAREYLAHYQSGLRAGDALHLAIAHNRGSTQIYTLDNTLLKAGRLLGLRMTRGI
jgi:predicted nucleic acid-binding protein